MSRSERRAKYGDIINQIGTEYREASNWLPFDALEISEVFSKDELKQLEGFVDEMESTTSDNDRERKFVDKINQYAPVVLKALKLAKIVV